MKVLLSRILVAFFIIILSLQLIPDLNAQTQIMSFEETLGFLSEKEYNLWERANVVYGNSSFTHVSQTQNVSGLLVWVIENGTYYQVEYPTLNILREIGNLSQSDDWDDPEGYYIWVLKDDIGMVSWVLANNGIIVEESQPRFGGPTSPPTPQPIQSPSNFEIAIIVITIVFGFGLLVNLVKKRKT